MAGGLFFHIVWCLVLILCGFYAGSCGFYAGSCGFYVGAGGTALRGAGARPNLLDSFSSYLQKSAAWGGGELRGSKSRKSTAHLVSDFHPILSGSGCALRGWAEGPARRPGDLKVAQAPPKSKPHARPSAAGKPTTVFPPKIGTSPNSPQFSAPCQPHCGSAVAPPRFRAPARFNYIQLTAEIAESLL